MDFSDDVAYSVHDFEDAIVEGFIQLEELNVQANEDAIVTEIERWNGNRIPRHELVAAMNDGDRLADVRQVQGFFYGGVAATDHHDVLVFVEKTVARGATRHASSHEGFFRGQAQIFGRRTSGDDQCVAGVNVARVACQGEGTLRKIDFGDVVEHHFGFEALGVFQEARH